MRDLPSVDAQKMVLNRWFVKFGNRRPSEAAMEVTAMSESHRRKLFRGLRDLKCIEPGDDGWVAVRALPTTEAAIVNADD